MSCFLCGEYKCSELAHDQSITHAYNLLKHLLQQRNNKKNLRLEEQFNLEDDISIAKKRYKMHMETQFDCGGLEDGTCVADFETEEEAIEHEMKCLKFTRPTVYEVKKEYKSDLVLTCKICRKNFYHTKFHPRYALNRHAKVCEKALSRNLKQQIKEGLKDLDLETLKEIVSLMP